MTALFRAFLALAGVLASSQNSICLPDGIAASARQLIGTVESYPIGVWVNDWPAGHAVAHAIAILIQEVMGYEVEMKGPGAGTPDGFFAVAGCKDPTNSSDRQCEGVTHTLVHVNVEGWTTGYFTIWQMIQDKYPTLAPKNLGNAGYDGSGGAYIAEAVQDRAYNAEGLSLDFHREYNVSWKDPSKFFALLDSVDISRLLFCNETNLMDSSQIDIYVAQTGDEDGVVSEGGNRIGKCWREHFWFSPACRQDESRCIPYFTGGEGWGTSEVLQKATGFNIALAWSVGRGWGNFSTLPLEYGSLFYWWTPDTTFLRMNPLEIAFPATDRLAWEQGDYRSQYAKTSIDTHVSKDLSVLAPEVEELLKAYKLQIKDVNDIMLDKLDSDGTDRDAACRWLNANTERWKRWLPDKTTCFPGFGLYDTVTQTFVPSRDGEDASIECIACPSGYASEQLSDNKGLTYICQACAPGTAQASGASLSCDPCARGESQGAAGSKSCLRCEQGKYQDVIGRAQCKPCPMGTNSLGLGSISKQDCACAMGSINKAAGNISNASDVTFECVTCGEGLSCPFSSSVETFRGGSSMGDAYTPKTEAGFVSAVSADESIEVFKCRPSSHCPGGPPQTCAGGLEGQLCSRCKMGERWAGTVCSTCQPGETAGWYIFLVVVLACSAVGYYFLNLPGQSKNTPPNQFFSTLGLVAHAVQSVAVFGLMTVTWPSGFTETTESFQIVLFDLSGSTLTCLTGWNELVRFLLSAWMFPMLVLWLLLCWLLSKVISGRFKSFKSWLLPHTFNTIGVILQGGFATVCAVALQPMMCYRHPNGTYSLLKYPSVFCGDDQQVAMLAIGCVLLITVVLGFLVVCSWAAYKIPAWSAAQESKKVQAFRFLTGKFRVDIWWFGLLMLLRGLSFSIIIVFATDVQRAQSTLATITILAYFAVQASNWPWKSRSVNLADLVLNGLLLLLITQSSQEPTASDARFAMDATLGILVLLICSVGLLFLVNAYDLLLKLKPEWQTGADRVQQIREALSDCAQKLLDIEAEKMKSQMNDMNFYDLQAVEKAIAIISIELQDGQWAFMGQRLNKSTMNQSLRDRLSVAVAAPKQVDTAPDDDVAPPPVAAAPVPVPATAVASDSNNAPTKSSEEVMKEKAEEIGIELTTGKLVSAEL